MDPCLATLHSNTPHDPFKKSVFDPEIISSNFLLVFGPTSIPILSSGIP